MRCEAMAGRDRQCSFPPIIHPVWSNWRHGKDLPASSKSRCVSMPSRTLFPGSLRKAGDHRADPRDRQSKRSLLSPLSKIARQSKWSGGAIELVFDRGTVMKTEESRSEEHTSELQSLMRI